MRLRTSFCVTIDGDIETSHSDRQLYRTAGEPRVDQPRVLIVFNAASAHKIHMPCSGCQPAVLLDPRPTKADFHLHTLPSTRSTDLPHFPISPVLLSWCPHIFHWYAISLGGNLDSDSDILRARASISFYRPALFASGTQCDGRLLICTSARTVSLVNR